MTWKSDPAVDTADAVETEAKRMDALEATREAARRGDWDAVWKEAQREKRATEAKAKAGTARKIDEADSLAALARLAPEPPALISPPFGKPPPDPVLWRKPTGLKDWKDPLLAVGDVAVLSGPGMAGKSTLTLALAWAAGRQREFGEACGLRVKCGRVAILSYEDAPERLAQRMAWYTHDLEPGANSELWDHVRIAPAQAPPLWTAGPDDRRAAGPSGWWSRWWAAVREFDPVLVVIDPASVAFAGANPNDGAAVRAFLLDLAGEAKVGGFGVLVVAHDTKAGRRSAKAGEDPGADAIAGSSQWYDGARGALHLANGLLACTKSNYGPSGWGATIRERRDGEDRFQGFELDRLLTPEEVKAERGRQQENARQGADTTGDLCKGLNSKGKPCRNPGLAAFDGYCKTHRPPARDASADSLV